MSPNFSISIVSTGPVYTDTYNLLLYMQSKVLYLNHFPTVH